MRSILESIYVLEGIYFCLLMAGKGMQFHLPGRCIMYVHLFSCLKVPGMITHILINYTVLLFFCAQSLTATFVWYVPRRVYLFSGSLSSA